MGILFGLVAALCFGLADFVVTQATRRTGVLQALLAIQLFGVILVGGVLVIAQASPPRSLDAWIFMIGISVVNFVGTLLLYRAFTIGTLSLVSPIASGFAVVTAVLALWTGERPSLLPLLGTLLLIVGVIVVARFRESTAPSSLAGLPEAVGVTICFGVYFWALNRITPTFGVLWPVWITRLVQLLCALLILGSRRSLKLSIQRPMTLLLFAAAVLDSSALLAFNLGIGQTYTTIATALTSLYSAITIVLAWLFLHERLRTGQWIGVGVILAGVLLVSV
jgi:drug/metabolite transporter (DMT)-like permease